MNVLVFTSIYYVSLLHDFLFYFILFFIILHDIMISYFMMTMFASKVTVESFINSISIKSEARKLHVEIR